MADFGSGTIEKIDEIHGLPEPGREYLVRCTALALPWTNRLVPMLRLRNSGSTLIQPRNLATEAVILQQINEFISTTQDDQALKLAFGEDLNNEAITALRNGSPYQSKSEFVRHNSTDSSGTVTGLALWARFEAGRTSENQTGGSESGAAASLVAEAF